MVKQRLDKVLVERGLAPSRERAQALILAGKVLVDGQKIEKAGAPVAEGAAIRLLGEDLKYVSRGGLKLERALEHWQIDLSGRTCMDVGASTGGFTDAMLQAGAARAIAVDTGYGQIDATLRNDPRVRLLERTNARHLTVEQVAPLADAPVSFVAMDVSFISATLVLPAVVRTVLALGAAELELVVLVKPQFEAGREAVGKGGIVRDPAARAAAIKRVREAVEALGGTKLDVIDSPITGAEGNQEFLLHAVYSAI
ncbi:MAG TPA: TlyA family RNA methyltransferase [Terriglobales bacterium]|jgi:23S rRNA (cytidine1920-2'-O)/16S rRNA (cytidine1409-2'-O)-methyltransferase|nr:TlyA family RNA methyltransferase [Terriglobales bacterium]